VPGLFLPLGWRPPSFRFFNAQRTTIPASGSVLPPVRSLKPRCPRAGASLLSHSGGLVIWYWPVSEGAWSLLNPSGGPFSGTASHSVLLRQIHGKPFQVRQRTVSECAFVGGPQHDRRRLKMDDVEISPTIRVTHGTFLRKACSKSPFAQLIRAVQLYTRTSAQPCRAHGSSRE
jgi:hypothetical protein